MVFAGPVDPYIMGPPAQPETDAMNPITTRMKSILLLGAVLLAAAMPAALPAAEEEKITINFVNADIQSVVKTVGQHTGRNFILDPRVTGTVNIVSDKPVSKDLLYQIFLSALRVQGFAAVEGDGFVKIVPEAEAKTSASPVGPDATRAAGDRVVTQVFILQNESAVQLVPVLRPLITANNFIAAYPNNNAIVITDYASNVRRIERIIQSIDLPSGADVQILRLANASAIDIAQMLNKVVPETTTSPTAPGAPPKVAVAVDSRKSVACAVACPPAALPLAKAASLLGKASATSSAGCSRVETAITMYCRPSCI